METILKTLKATADGSRLRLLRVLGRGAFSVAELTEVLGVSQSTVSKHLKVLSDAGLVTARRTGTWAYYSLQPAGGEAFDDRLMELLIASLGEVGDEDAAAVSRVVANRRKKTSEFFRAKASQWDAVRDELLGPPHHLDELVEWADATGTAVDLGTGTGVLLGRLASTASRVIGVDASAEMLEEAERRVTGDGTDNTELRLGALEHLPLSDGEADTMVANLVLHHVADPVAVLREIHRGLAPGGRLVLAELREYADESFWKKLGARWPGFRPEDMNKWLKAAGFEAVRVQDLNGAANRDSPHAKNPTRPGVFLLEARRLERNAIPNL
ncbi:MAG: metalloregulator ArsR/SmtB family transcription factor [Gemmatimonadetes bacterium]|nr:metalloregulator ArsR/SmtB family transcription factor [Gemmatimonadota bacterium]